MKKFNKFIQFLWLAVAAVSAVEGYLEYAKSNQANQKVYVWIGVFVAAIAMYSIRKRHAKNIK